MPIENPRVRGSIPRLATTELKLKAHSSEWAFCYLASYGDSAGLPLRTGEDCRMSHEPH